LSIHTVPQLPSHEARIDTDPDARTCTIWYIRRELGRADYGEQRFVTYLAQLVDQAGFPRPIPCHRKGKADLFHGVCPESRFLRDAVDAWLLDYTSPPPVADALERRARTAAAAEMDEAAASLNFGRAVRGAAQ